MNMQRKLTAALVGVALSAIVLVGAGVLVFAQIGARQAATIAVEEQLHALQVVTDRSETTPLQTIEPSLRRVGEAFGNGQVSVVLVDDDGHVEQLPLRGNEGHPIGIGSIDLAATEVEALQAGEIITSDEGRTVVGLLAVSAGNRPDRLAGTPSIFIRQSVGVISSRAIVWFVLSAAIVLLMSAVAGGWLARRFTKPIRSIEQATTAIAGGRLDTRVAEVGTDEVGQLARSVNSMAADLERSRSAEQQFLLSITHDLRTPLTSITGYAEALVDGAVDDARRAGSIIGANAARLDRLVGDLLTLARLEAQSFTFHNASADIAAITSRQVIDKRHHAESFGLTITLDDRTDGNAFCTIDPDRTGQVIDNLIENAIKFAASSVTIRVEGDAEMARVSVVDDGPGIPADDLPFVFERLYVTKLRPVRAESSSGLGLAIVRELVEGMGGTVAATSHGVGTTITLTFPRTADPHNT